MTISTAPSDIRARRLLVSGRVQGVGFRPFVLRVAHSIGLSGWVRNQCGQVEILAQGPVQALAAFEQALLHQAPPLAQPTLAERNTVCAEPLDGFKILPSNGSGTADIHLPPDYFACDECLAELRDPRNRRYRYPFINCTQCGPRYTLITRLPYDRPNTTMAGFALCVDCQAEYEDPGDRRFHAEPIACAVCGPQLSFSGGDGAKIIGNEPALQACLDELRRGGIVAVKGVGGYHLMCDARNEDAVARLRHAKPRPHKPLAVMFPLRGEDGLDGIRTAAMLLPEHAALLRDPMRPIVLVPRATCCGLASGIAPRLDEMGVMLPYSPLHHLLLEEFGAPLIATSANISGEPVLTEESDIETRLARVADAFLHHNRPIRRPADDSVFRIIAGHPRPLRLGRGAAPLELGLPRRLEQPALAVGGHMKNTIALAWDERVVISPHVGDLGTPRSLAIFEQVIADLQEIYSVRAQVVICDAHPGYASHGWACRCGKPVTTVLHHPAHASALAGEFPEIARWLVFTWDGVGYGANGTLWGGEALLGSPGAWSRVGTMRPFFLPGGEKAGREPWRSALAVCWEAGMTWPECAEETTLLHAAWRRRINTPQSTSVGRLFDAAAALTGLHLRSSFEGQGPMYLEATSAHDGHAVPLPLGKNEQGVWQTDWAPLLPWLTKNDVPVPERAATFHETLAQALVAQACAVRAESGEFMVGLCGGVFQNRLLTGRCCALLDEAGFDVRLNNIIPCNDAGLSFGQIMEYARREHAS